MTKEEFLFLLLGASFASFKFAEKYVKNPLKAEFKYDLELLTAKEDLPKKDNLSYEDNLTKHFNLSDKEVIEILYKDGKLPVWIDICVSKSNTKFTTLNLLCSEYYTHNKEKFVYNKSGSGPFGIKSPTFPPGQKEGKKFRLSS